MQTETYNLVTVVIYSVSAGFAFLMLGVAIWQLHKLALQIEQAVKSNSINQLNALLAIEQQIADRRLELSKAGIAVTELKGSNDTNKLDSVSLRFNEAKEMYLNGLDRLCFCVIKNLLHDDEMRLEYMDIIKSAVTDFPEDFNTGTPYRNIKKVYEKWADK